MLESQSEKETVVQIREGDRVKGNMGPTNM